MIGALSARPTALHRVSAGVKLVVLCVFCTGVSMAGWPGAGWVGLAVVLLGGLALGRWFAGLILRDLKGPALIAALIFGFQWFAGRFDLGVSLAGTLLACISAAMMLSRTTSPAELLDVVDGWLARMRLPRKYRQRLALAIALTLRFIPAISGRSDVLRLAHLARSPKRPGWRLVTPLAIGTLDEADQAADALRARAHIE